MGLLDGYGDSLPEGLDERRQQLEKKMSGFDWSNSIEFPFAWNGEYLFRVMPILDLTDWLVPRGFHYNLYPTGDPQKQSSQDGCPQFTYGEDCPVCRGILKLVSEKKAESKEFGMSGSGIAVQKRFLLRVLLVETSKLTKSSQSKRKIPIPEWADGDLPSVKILACPPSVSDALLAMQTNPRIGWRALTHPKEGLLIQVIRDDTESDPKKIYSVLPLQSHPIPEQFLTDAAINAWPDLKDFLPQTSTKHMLDVLQKHQLDIDPRIYNAAMAIDIGPKALPAGEDDTKAEEEKLSTVEAMKERLGKLGKK